jgi:hypothetical protein
MRKSRTRTSAIFALAFGLGASALSYGFSVAGDEPSAPVGGPTTLDFQREVLPLFQKH